MPVLTELLPKAIDAVCIGKPKINVGLWADALDPFMWAEGITTPLRIAAFIGQIAVESDGFTKLEEDLDYSAERLCEVWPSHFDRSGRSFSSIRAPRTDLCAHNPEMLANVVYCNRMGNGGYDSGDGYTFRGAGLIQLTGRANQSEFGASCKMAPEQVGAYLRTATGAARSACWFWGQRSLNRYADAWMLTRISVAINGGIGANINGGSVEGLMRRIELCNAARKACAA
jgi:putative chitinase